MSPKHRASGITLMELMIVVAIVGLLAAIAYPSYRQYSIRSNRTEAKAAMLQMAQALEKCYTTSHTYVGCAGVATTNTAAGHYEIDPTLNAQTYLIEATPQGGQADDTDCGILSLDDRGVRRERDGEGMDPANKCW